MRLAVPDFIAAQLLGAATATGLFRWLLAKLIVLDRVARLGHTVGA